MGKEVNIRLIASLQIVTAIGLVLFWAAFFIVGMVPDKPSACYFAYEHALPLPDGLLAVLLLVNGILLMKNSTEGKKLSLVAAGALMFLGLLNFSFNIQNGTYTSSAPDLVINAFIDLWCFGFGLLTAVWMMEKNV